MKKIILFAFIIIVTTSSTFTDPKIKAAQGIIERITPDYVSGFSLEIMNSKDGKDVFEISSIDDKVLLKGNNTISLAVAYHQYLKKYCKVSLSWCGDQLDMPKILPLPLTPEYGEINAKYRSFFNYCSFSYSTTWWKWERWQREIDFMAMNGVNMPLSIVGLEGVWYNALQRIGYTEEEAREYLVGPSYFAWQWMTNIESYGGPLPKSWIKSHIKLGKKIIDREIELGMHPIQQGYSGCVPSKFIEKFPDAKIELKESWCGFKPVAQLDPTDSLFQVFGRILFEEQDKLFGSHGFYATDPFHESKPLYANKEYFEAVANSVLKLYKDFDPMAIWIMQGWSPTEAIVKAIPMEDLIILDISDTYYKTSQDAVKEAFWGYPYVVGNLHNFGGRINMHGDLKLLATNQFYNAIKLGKNIVGSGLFMEGLGQNPIYYDLAFEMPIHKDSVDLNKWIREYSIRRYGSASENAYKALKLLLENPYASGSNGVENSSIVAARPAVIPKKSGPNRGFSIPYNQESLWKAQDLLLNAVKDTENGEKMRNSSGYLFDIVDLQRQLMSNLGQSFHKKAAEAFNEGDLDKFDLYSKRFIQLLYDLDKVLKTRQEYSFESKYNEAMAWATDNNERELYNFNVSMLVTQWGGQPEPEVLFDYAWKEWSGLIREYYAPRWEKFYAMLRKKIVDGTFTSYNEDALPRRSGREALRANDFYSHLADWEKDWIYSIKKYSNIKYGGEYEIVSKMYHYYLPYTQL